MNETNERRCKITAYRAQLIKRSALFTAREYGDIIKSGEVIRTDNEEIAAFNAGNPPVHMTGNKENDLLEFDGRVLDIYRGKFLVEIAGGMVLEAYAQSIRLL